MIRLLRALKPFGPRENDPFPSGPSKEDGASKPTEDAAPSTAPMKTPFTSSSTPADIHEFEYAFDEFEFEKEIASKPTEDAPLPAPWAPASWAMKTPDVNNTLQELYPLSPFYPSRITVTGIEDVRLRGETVSQHLNLWGAAMGDTLVVDDGYYR